MSDARPDSYERDVERARAEGTDVIERTDDLPPPDQYRAAHDLAEMLRASGADLAALAAEIGLPDVDPARWERLDVARAASYARERFPEAFASVAAEHPWLGEAAEESAHDPLGALADRFLGH